MYHKEEVHYMLYIRNDATDPFYNQAFEEYIFEHCNPEEDILLLWVNDPSLICGRYQNVFQEINMPLAYEQSIPVIRRNTGGGTVYHDRGNLNYSIIRKRNEGENLDYDSFLTPVIDALNNIGVPAHKRNVCDIAIDNMKISGSAQAVKKDRVLHHGTLLYNADLKNLRGLLKPAPGKMICKAVGSVPSPVTNIIEHLQGDGYNSIEEFKEKFKTALMGKNGCETAAGEDVIAEVSKLKEEKYLTRQWNIGKGPKFEFYPENKELYLKIEAGIVIDSDKKEYIGEFAEDVFREVYNEKNNQITGVR